MPVRPEDGVWSPETGVIDNCETPNLGPLNSGPPEEQEALSTYEPSLQFLNYGLWRSKQEVELP